MDAMYANYYTREVMVILVREFQTPDEEMKKIVLKVVKQCVGTDGVEPDYIRHEILPEFFRNFWVRRMALDRRNYRQLVETTVELAQKVSQTLICNVPTYALYVYNGTARVACIIMTPLVATNISIQLYHPGQAVPQGQCLHVL